MQWKTLFLPWMFVSVHPSWTRVCSVTLQPVAGFSITKKYSPHWDDLQSVTTAQVKIRPLQCLWHFRSWQNMESDICFCIINHPLPNNFLIAKHRMDDTLGYIDVLVTYAFVEDLGKSVFQIVSLLFERYNQQICSVT